MLPSIFHLHPKMVLKTLHGENKNLTDFQGKVLLIVNVASRCSFTAQYAELEKLYQRYASQGFIILGFPCNQFGQQEPGSATEIQHFCQINYGITFPLFQKIDVNGPHAHPLYNTLTSQKPGLFNTKAIKWNFTKFLITRTGQVYQRYAPIVSVQHLEKDLGILLKKNS